MPDQVTTPDAVPTETPDAEAQDTGDPESQPAPVKFRIRDQEYSEDDLAARLELASKADEIRKSSYKKFEESAKARKEAEEIADAFRTDPRRAFKKYGVDARQFAEQLILEELQAKAQEEEFQRDPDAKKRHDDSLELEQLRAEKKTREEQEAQAKLDQETNTAREHYNQLFMKALETGGLPVNEATVKRMATLQLKALDLIEAGKLQPQDVTPEALAQAVREEIAAEHRTLYANLDDEAAYKLLGDELAQKVRRANLAQLKPKPQTQTSVPAEVPPTRRPRKSHVDLKREHQERLERIKRGEE